MSLSIIFGGLFDQLDKDSFFLKLTLREKQLIALSYFASFTGIYNSYKHGVLTGIYNREIDFDEDN